MSDNVVTCPSCRSPDIATIESRPVLTGSLYTRRRRKECRSCGHRFTTAEVPYQLAKEIYDDAEQSA